jgi:hypothetical protein
MRFSDGAGYLKFPHSFATSLIDSPGAGTWTYKVYCQDTGVGTSGFYVGCRSRSLARDIFKR